MGSHSRFTATPGSRPGGSRSEEPVARGRALPFVTLTEMKEMDAARLLSVSAVPASSQQPESQIPSKTRGV